MRPSERFTKKVWRKPPKEEAKGFKTCKKIGLVKCAICKQTIPSTKQNRLRDNYNPAKSTIRTNRPYGGYLCNSCLKLKIIEKTEEVNKKT